VTHIHSYNKNEFIIKMNYDISNQGMYQILSQTIFNCLISSKHFTWALCRKRSAREYTEDLEIWLPIWVHEIVVSCVASILK